MYVGVEDSVVAAVEYVAFEEIVVPVLYNRNDVLLELFRNGVLVVVGKDGVVVSHVDDVVVAIVDNGNYGN